MPDDQPAAQPATPDPVPGGRSRRPGWRSVLKWLAVVVVVGFIVAYVVQEWTGFVAGLRRLDALSIAGAVLAILAGLVCAMQSWRATLAGLGSPLPFLAGARVFFLGQLGKYVPGSVWPILAQAELSSEYDVPRARTGLASLTQMLIGLVTGVCVAGGTLAVSSPEAFESYWWLLLVAVAGVVVLVPPVFNRLVALALRLTRRQPAGTVSPRAVIVAALWCLGMWATFGLHLWLLARALGATGSGLFWLSTGAYALAWVVGFVIVLLPAGAGAREAALVLALAPVLDRESALVLAVVSRILMLVGDGLCAAAAIVAEKARRRRSAVRAAGSTGSP